MKLAGLAGVAVLLFVLTGISNMLLNYEHEASNIVTDVISYAEKAYANITSGNALTNSDIDKEIAELITRYNKTLAALMELTPSANFNECGLVILEDATVKNATNNIPPNVIDKAIRKLDPGMKIPYALFFDEYTAYVVPGNTTYIIICKSQTGG